MVGFYQLCVFLLLVCGKISAKKPNDINEMVPPVYETDDFVKCKTEGDLFCRIKFLLTPTDPGSEVWQIIQKSKEDEDRFSRDVVYRLRCLPKILDGNSEEIVRNLSRKENMLMEKFSLRAHSEDFSCINYSKAIDIRIFDYFVLFFSIGYLTLVAWATINDTYKLKKDDKRAQKYIRYFSILSNWSELHKPITDPDYIKLTFLQGVRTYNMVLVIIVHTICNMMFAYVSDTNYVELIHTDIYRRYLFYSVIFAVQVNFVISGWLLAKQLYSEVDKKKVLPISYLVRKTIQRYLKLIPVPLVIILWQMSNLLLVLAPGFSNERKELDYEACQKNWWATLLFANNIFLSKDMCNLGMWYLAIDFQLHIIFSIMFYLMHKFKLGTKVILWMMALMCTINGYFVYTRNLGVCMLLTPDGNRVENSIGSYNLNIVHTSVYTNFGGYAIGFIFGGIYHKYKHQEFKMSKLNWFLWTLAFYGPPLISSYLVLHKYPPLVSAILGATIKPFYSLGIATGFLGMAFGTGGIVKKICEWSFVEFLAKWTYSTFIIHFFVVFGRTFFLVDLMEVSDSILVTSWIMDLVMSFSAGLLVHLVIERPLSKVFNLDNIFLKAKSK